MTAVLEKLLNVRREELGAPSSLFAFLFLVIGSYIIGISVGDAMFLKAFPNNLPHVIVGTAVVVGAFASVYIRLSQRVGLQWLMIGSLVFFALSFAVFGVLARYQVRMVFPFIYIWVYMTGAVAPAMGWTLANYVLTVREARRVFGFIGAGQVLGAPVAAFSTAFLIKRHFVREETMLIVVAVSLGVCALLVRLVFKQARERLKGFGLAVHTGKQAPKNFSQIWTTIRDSRYLSLITALIAVGCATTTIIGYQFKIVAKASYGPDRAALAAFFANFNGYMGLAAFLVQTLLTGRLLKRFGIRVTLFVLPVIFFGGSMGVLLAPTLLAVSMLKGSHSILRFSLDKSTAELLYLPVAPPDIKSQIKAFIDGFIWRSADGVAGLVLWIFADVLKFTAGRISLVNFFFIGGWIAVAYGVRREYLNVLLKAFERNEVDPDRIAISGVLDSTTTEVLGRALERAGEQQALYGLSLFEVGRHTAWHPALRGLLDHPSAAVRQRALRLLSDASDRAIIAKVEKLLNDPSTEVRTEALHYLVVHAGRDPLDLLTGETNLPDYSVQGSVVAYLARSGTPEHFFAAQLIFRSMLEREDSEAAHSRAEAARILGLIPSPCELHAELGKLLRDNNPEVVEQAILAAGKVLSRDDLPRIMEKLSDPRFAGAARSTLSQYGERAVGTLKDYLNDPGVPLAVRKQVPAILCRIPTAESAKVLTDSLVQADPGLRYDVLKALNKLCRHDEAMLAPSVDFADMLEAELMGYYRSFQILAAFDAKASFAPGHARAGEAGEPLLTRALREHMAQELERIFRLMALIYPARKIYNAYIALTSGRPQLQANALEVLENLLRPDLFRRLAFGFDPEVTMADKLKYAERLCHTTVPSPTEALRALIHSDDPWLCACALYAVGTQGLKELESDVQRMMVREFGPVLKETRSWAISRLSAPATA